MNERPPMTLIMSWIDIETLLLLFGMMILVAILSETGVFDYLAVYAFKVCISYRHCQLILQLCLIILDNKRKYLATHKLSLPLYCRLVILPGQRDDRFTDDASHHSSL